MLPIFLPVSGQLPTRTIPHHVDIGPEWLLLIGIGPGGKFPYIV